MIGGEAKHMHAAALSDAAADRAAYADYVSALAGDDSAFRGAFREAFFRALREQLTPRQYEVLWACEVEGKSGRQTAKTLGISPSAVSRHLSRGKRRLRVLLSYNLELRHERFEE